MSAPIEQPQLWDRFRNGGPERMPVPHDPLGHVVCACQWRGMARSAHLNFDETALCDANDWHEEKPHVVEPQERSVMPGTAGLVRHPKQTAAPTPQFKGLVSRTHTDHACAVCGDHIQKKDVLTAFDAKGQVFLCCSEKCRRERHWNWNNAKPDKATLRKRLPVSPLLAWLSPSGVPDVSGHPGVAMCDSKYYPAGPWFSRWGDEWEWASTSTNGYAKSRQKAIELAQSPPRENKREPKPVEEEIGAADCKVCGHHVSTRKGKLLVHNGKEVGGWCKGSRKRGTPCDGVWDNNGHGYFDEGTGERVRRPLLLEEPLQATPIEKGTKRGRPSRTDLLAKAAAECTRRRRGKNFQAGKLVWDVASVEAAAKKHGIGRSTLRRYLSKLPEPEEQQIALPSASAPVVPAPPGRIKSTSAAVVLEKVYGYSARVQSQRPGSASVAETTVMQAGSESDLLAVARRVPGFIGIVSVTEYTKPQWRRAFGVGRS